MSAPGHRRREADIQREGTLTIFVPGRLTNPMNGPHGHWSTRAKWAREWRQRTGAAILHHVAQHRAGRQLGPYGERLGVVLGEAMHVSFLLHTWNAVDSDALGPMVKPCRDALIDMRLIHSDAPDSGHVFEYAQVVNRKARGVTITITPRTP